MIESLGPHFARPPRTRAERLLRLAQRRRRHGGKPADRITARRPREGRGTLPFPHGAARGLRRASRAMQRLLLLGLLGLRRGSPRTSASRGGGSSADSPKDGGWGVSVTVSTGRVKSGICSGETRA
jgi:hypothetical protein